MIDYLWAAMIGIGIIVAAFLGKLDVVGEGVVASSGEAMDLLFVMAGVICMWNGILCIAEKSGLVQKMTHAMKPLLRFVFPDLPMNHEATDYIAENFIANVLGLSWACTPSGLKAIKALQKLQRERGRDEAKASDEMCTFLLLNISSLQLIPMNMIAYRSQYGSVNPTAVVGSSLVATFLTTIAALVFAKGIYHYKKSRKRNRRHG